MTTTSATGANSAAGTLTGSAGNGLSNVDFNTFLKLLVAQLKNQDPLNPLDGTEFTGQIAQFSALEQQIGTNNQLAKLLEQRDYGQQTLAVSYIGKVALAPGDKMAIGKEGGGEFAYKLGTAAAGVEVGIYDKDGKLVRTTVGDTSEGNHIVTWDGKNDAGDAVGEGTYTVRVKAIDAEGKTMPSTVLTYGRVASVITENGTSSILMGDGRSVALGDILAVTSL